MKNRTLQLKFYTKSDCPLCDEAKLILKNVQAKLPFIAVEEIDITKNLGLFSKYKLLIPVLEMNGKQLSMHRIKLSKLIWQLRWYRLRFHFSNQ